MTVRQRTSDRELRYTSAPQRREEILRRMRGTGYVSAPELSVELAVSERTVRRDLQKLAEQGLVDLVYGGALAPTGVAPGSPFLTRVQAQYAQKRAIANQALQLVEPGATIGIDAGTTTLEMARLLPPGSDVTVVTHSLPAMGAVGERDDLTLIGLGGLLHPSTQTFTGPDTITTISRLRVHTFFLAASGLGPDGAYCSSPLDAEAKRAFIGIAERVVLLTDSSKLRQIAPVPICDYGRLDALITDDAITDADRTRLASRTRLLIAAG
ncbi:DeoR/GlpR family DNA-binding transcription regulator [Micromonospora soli]|uniref:DeoR/GlpR family DNA-binding transcription regulator n=1 Tax=Micromonospora sp. NBRC 110009 TaxID=3061627 RepID=UPI002672DC26|nr:DeoR/GlpR family DNA-binding transcription regulator [Micromonospora sp. NBRC 110009]WKT99202.1 DeoR/GlpR family DNA-binding transcription regulator [Micromonospora sp. NBRC 110009]